MTKMINRTLIIIFIIIGLLVWEGNMLGLVNLDTWIKTELFAVIVGTIMGFGLSELAQITRENREEKKEHRAIRLLLSSEIELNLQKLDESWKEIKRNENPSESMKIKYARHIAHIPFPTLTQTALQSQMRQLPDSVSFSVEIRVRTARHGSSVSPVPS